MAKPDGRNRRTHSLTPIRANLPVPGKTPTEPIYAKRRPGRPTLMTLDVTTRFLNAIRAANDRGVAARFAGINPETVEHWIRRGRGQVHKEPPLPEHIEFARMVEEAEAAAEVMIIGNLASRSKVNTEAGIFIATRKWGRRWPHLPDEEAAAPPPPPVVIDNRQQSQNVIVLTGEQFGDLVHNLLGRQREERAAATPPDVIEELRPDRVVRHERLNGLRAESD